MIFSKYTQTNKNELFPPTAGIKFIGKRYMIFSKYTQADKNELFPVCSEE
jgi:hypothetical protein